MLRVVLQLSAWAQKLANLLVIVLVFLVTEQVIERYLFSTSSIAIQELEWHLFGAIFWLGAANCLRKDEHVRVDLFYSRWTPRTKAICNLIGHCVFLVPTTIILILYGFDFVMQARSYGINETDGFWAWFLGGERSPDPGGLPARWIIKAIIPFSAFFLFVEGLRLIVNNFKTIRAG